DRGPRLPRPDRPADQQKHQHQSCGFLASYVLAHRDAYLGELSLPEFAGVCRNYFCTRRSAAQTRFTASRISLGAGGPMFRSESHSSISSASLFSLFGTCTQPVLGSMQRWAISAQMLNQSCVTTGPRRRGGGASGSTACCLVDAGAASSIGKSSST